MWGLCVPVSARSFQAIYSPVECVDEHFWTHTVSLFRLHHFSFPVVSFTRALSVSTLTPPAAPLSQQAPSLLKPQTPKTDVTLVSGFCHSNITMKKRHFWACWLWEFVMVSIWLFFPSVLWWCLSNDYTAPCSVCRPSLYFWAVKVCAHVFLHIFDENNNLSCLFCRVYMMN